MTNITNATDITIYHNPQCGTSRNTLALIRHAGLEPRIVPYLQQPPTRAELVALLAALGTPVREAMRAKEAIDKATAKRRWMLTANAPLDHYKFHSCLRRFDMG